MRAAVIGTGFQGRLHVESLAAIDGVDVVAVADLDESRAAEVAREYGIGGVYGGYRALLEAEAPLDVVTVCTMPNTHREIVLAAIEAGAHVLCEKPFAMNAVEAAEMVSAAEASGRTLAVGFNMRFMGSTLAVRRFVESGRLGTPICARGFMLADDVPWWGKHYVRGISGGGALAATAVHMIDLVRWLAGSPAPLTASASMAQLFPRKRRSGAPSDQAAAMFDTEDIVFGHIRFDNGFWMSVEGAWVWEKPGWNYSFDLIGDRAQASLDPLSLVEEVDGRRAEVPAPPADTDFPPSVAREIEDLVSALQDRRRPTIAANAREALVTQAIVDALYRSAELGHEVDVVVPEIASRGGRS